MDVRARCRVSYMFTCTISRDFRAYPFFVDQRSSYIFAVIHVRQTTYQIVIRLIDSESQISGGVILPRLIKTNLSFIFKWCR